MAAVANDISITIAANAPRRPKRSAHRPTRIAPSGLAKKEVAKTANTGTRPPVPDPPGSRTAASTDANAP